MIGMRALAAHRANELRAVAVGQAEVEDDQVGRIVLEQRRRFADRHRRQHLEAFGGERRPQQRCGSRGRPRR